MEVLPLSLKVPVPEPHRVGNALKLAVAVALADVAVLRVVVQDELHDVAPGAPELLSVCSYLYTVVDWEGTGSHIVLHPLHLDDADSARALDGKLRMVTEPGNTEAQRVSSLHDSLIRLDTVRLVIYMNRNHQRSSPYTFLMALNLQLR